jgi:hypothetical protein
MREAIEGFVQGVGSVGVGDAAAGRVGGADL